MRGQGDPIHVLSGAADEVLDRLLELNKERYEAEVAAGLHTSDKAAEQAARRRPASQDSLLGDDE